MPSGRHLSTNLVGNLPLEMIPTMDNSRFPTLQGILESAIRWEASLVHDNYLSLYNEDCIPLPRIQVDDHGGV